ncbi:MAG: DUF819 family protein [Rhodothermales bacterium]
MTHPMWIVAVLAFIVAASEWLSVHTRFKHIGSGLLVIVFGALLANLGIIPTGGSTDVPVYDGVFSYVASLGIFWLLLQVNLRDLLRAGTPILVLFVVGAVGTVLGVLAGLLLIGGGDVFGSDMPALGGMFIGTYIGGSVNFNAVALAFDVVRDGGLYGGSVVVDNIATALWIGATLIAPKVLAPLWRTRRKAVDLEAAETGMAAPPDEESVGAVDVGVLLALGGAGLWLSDATSAWLAGLGVTLPSIIILTALALVIAQLPIAKRLRGAHVFGLFAVLVFLVVIGAYCDIAALETMGQLAWPMTVFVFVTILIHGLVTYAAAWLLRYDLDLASVASQANIGGSASALALAKSIGRPDLVLPAVLIGTLGNGIGTFIGYALAVSVLPLLA